jgi:hypothetical protein
MHSRGRIRQLTQREPSYIHAILAILESTAPSALDRIWGGVSLGLAAQAKIRPALRASPLLHNKTGSKIRQVPRVEALRNLGLQPESEPL